MIKGYLVTPRYSVSIETSNTAPLFPLVILIILSQSEYKFIQVTLRREVQLETDNTETQGYQFTQMTSQCYLYKLVLKLAQYYQYNQGEWRCSVTCLNRYIIA